MTGATQDQRKVALVSAIKDSGLGIAGFAERYLARDQSTVYRWLSGASPIPQAVERWLRYHAHELIEGET